MTIGELQEDPVVFVAEERAHLSTLRSVAAYVILSGLLIEAITFVASGPIIPRMVPKESTDTDGFSANLTALLALIAAVTSIYFTYRQLQAKVRASSRQAWIDKLRSHIARFIALADSAHSSVRNRACSHDPSEFTTCRIEMELMLNPSEKDHRLLMYLGLRLAFFRLGESKFQSIHDVRNIRKAIGIVETTPCEKHKEIDEICEDCKKFKHWESWEPLFKKIPSRAAHAEYKSEYSDLIGYTLRLTHVLLKREWEQVKATK